MATEWLQAKELGYYRSNHRGSSPLQICRTRHLMASSEEGILILISQKHKQTTSNETVQAHKPKTTVCKQKTTETYPEYQLEKTSHGQRNISARKNFTPSDAAQFKACKFVTKLCLCSPRRTSFAPLTSSLLPSHRSTMLLQSLTRVDRSASAWDPPSTFSKVYAFWASFLEASRTAFWQTCSQHSFTLSIFPQAARRLDESTVPSNSATSATGHEPWVRFEARTEHIRDRSSLAPWPARARSKSERQWAAVDPLRAREPVFLLDWPMRIARVASTWGQQTTLARRGANAAMQLVDVTVIMFERAVKFSGQCPVILKISILEFRILRSKKGGRSGDYE
ncbi:cell division protein SepF [Striga asiatica]|uniref:Cell division protein SepF n=1 Tax=Striga asiatica TaxID=4170 RepID=A0A5A7R5B1_STRAF|nr:cell division protein SepF [Striga asiatica]